MDAPEFTELLRRHAKLVQRIAWGYGRDAADREEIVQEVAVQLWRSHARFDPRFAESTWVYRIALNVAISFHRRERGHRERRLPVEVRELELAADCTRAGGSGGTDPRIATLRECIEELGELERALVLLWLDGNPHAAIADVLGISVSNVGTKLGRIKDELRLAFERRERKEDRDGTR